MVRSIDLKDLKKKMKGNERFHLVDVLPHEYFVKEHIPGSINLPVNELEQLANTVLPRNETIVVYCGSRDCKASPEAAKKLEEMGFQTVLDFESGVKGWKEAGLPVERSV